MRLNKFLHILNNLNRFKTLFIGAKPFSLLDHYLKSSSSSAWYVVVISFFLFPFHSSYSDTSNQKEEINSRNFIIEKEKKNSLNQSLRLYKKPPVSSEKPEKRETEIEEHELSFYPIDHNLRLLKAKEIELLPIYQHYLALGIECKNLVPRINYLLNSNRNVDLDYNLAIDIWMPTKLKYPQYLNSFGNLYWMFEESKVGVFYKYHINSSILEKRLEETSYYSITINNLNAGIHSKGWLTDKVKYDLRGGYNFFSTLGKIKNDNRPLMENEGSFQINSEITLGQYFISAIESNLEFQSSVNVAKFSFTDKEETVYENEYTRGLVKINPLLRLKTYDFNIGVGTILAGHNDKSRNTKGHIHPDIRIRYERYSLAIPFVFLKGDTSKIFWRDIYEQNSFVRVDDENILEHTNMPIKVGGGLTNNLPINLSLSYGYSWRYYSNMYFFEYQEDYFEIKYDKLKVHNPFAEILYKNSNEDLIVNFHVDYFIYGKMKNIDEPRYKPKYEIELFSMYKLIDRFHARGKIHWKGGIINSDEKMPDVIDLDLGADYYFTQRLSVSLDLENLLFRKNCHYTKMPGKGFLATVSLGYVW